MFSSVLLSCLVTSALAGTVLWDGRFNQKTIDDLDEWSWSNQVGQYQYYIHGDSNISSYVNLDSGYKNPADTGSTAGVKITLDSTSYWEGQTMRRTELIPQTTAAIGAGTVYYHFSLMKSATNAPSEFREHQIAFFESHFTEMKSGWIDGESGTSDATLRWEVNSASEWNVTWEAGVWHNIAYGIDFDAGSVAFYHSTGANDLSLVVDAVSVSASSNGADFHVGVLELPRTGYSDGVEDFYFSGVYVESGSITTSVSGPDADSGSDSASAASSSTVSTAQATTNPGTATVVPVQTTSSASSSSASVPAVSSIAPTSSDSASIASGNAAASTTLATVISSSPVHTGNTSSLTSTTAAADSGTGDGGDDTCE